MTVPTQPTYSAAALVAAHTALLALIDAAATAGEIRLRDSSDVLLATIVLDDPAGTVNGSTGQLTLTPAAEFTPSASGTAAYAEVADGDGNVHLSVPAAQGVAASSGYFVLNTLTLVSGQPAALLASTIG